MASEDQRRFKYKWTLPRFLVQLFSLVAVNALAITLIYPSIKIQPIPFALPILASINSPYTAIYSSLDLLQLELSQPEFPWIVIGSILLIGAIVGKALCGWICPIGFIQDIITTLKNKLDLVSPRTHKSGKKFKYFLLFLTFLFSGTLGLALYSGTGLEYKNALGPFATGPFTIISPDGTLFGTVPALIRLASENIASILSKPPTIQEVWNQLTKVPPLLALRLLILLGFFGAAWKVPRFWCRYICPTGALMAILQKHSLAGIKRDPVKCTKCPHCEIRCPMQINILDLSWEKFNDPECIMCMECIDACPHGSLGLKFP
ncbi:MAG TPA: 4Fe-4S binding protein [Candidatus Bathyarchaeia archaeon]|nr:4Fe-4S binding protein [Candidatus Bathyarchaeia archaeon]